MCNKHTDIYACGDEEVHEIPCSSSEHFDKDCSMKEEDVVINHGDRKCLECIHLDDQIKRLMEDKELAAPVGPVPSNPDSPISYFKQKTRWSVCGHYDSPTYTSVERQGSPEEWLVVEERGRCWGCTQTDPAVLANMKLCGELEAEDPFRALEREPPADAGPSGWVFRKSSVAHVVDEDLPPDAHPVGYMFDPDDEAYKSDYGDEEDISQDPKVPTALIIDNSSVSRLHGNNSIDKALPTRNSPEHMASNTSQSPGSLQYHTHWGSGTSQPVLTREDYDKYMSQGQYAVPSSIKNTMSKGKKPGKGEEGIPRRPKSNGIRFSITDLSPPTARILPTIYQDRCGISLYDAQYRNGKKIPIPQTVVEEVVIALRRFKRTCQDFGVVDDRVRIVATEATRNATNSQNFQNQIQTRTGWKVELLAKEEEGRVGAMGIASSFQNIKGLVLDLGGGSVQMTWMTAEDGNVQTSQKGSVSLPYGAAALTMLLEEAGTEGQAELRRELIIKFKNAIEDLEIPQKLKDASRNESGLALYLSGGGFRGWGYILMSLHALEAYPIPIINGFLVPISAFLPQTKQTESISNSDSTFRISSRRASQVPAITFLIRVLTQALPSISSIRFAQGGVREGLLFSQLPSSVRAQSPLVIATLPYAPPSVIVLTRLLKSAIPYSGEHANKLPPYLTSESFLTSTIQLLNAHSHLPKDIRAAAALRSTTTGLLASTHGLVHEERALLALVLCERWDGETSPTDADFLAKLQELVGQEGSWWAKYIGRLVQGLGDIFPAGLVRKEDDHGTLTIDLRWGISEMGKRRGEEVLRVHIKVLREDVDGSITMMKDTLEKLGKRKNWIGGKEGYGKRVEVNLSY